MIQAQPDALFIDVRMQIESTHVGRPPGVINIPWYEFPDFKPNPAGFVAAVAQIAKSKDLPVVLICRSGLRSVDGARVLEQAGFSQVINVLEGFEGELDDNDQRGTEAGWRFDGLPWTQS